jgi:CubicO group peptidase (beta-lactamase class C family)
MFVRGVALMAVMLASGGCKPDQAGAVLQRPGDADAMARPARAAAPVDAIVTPAETYPDAVEASIARILGDLRPPGAAGPVETLAERMAAGDVPGVAIAVVEDYRVHWVRGFGVRRSDGDVPVDARTLFEVGALSSTVVAAGALRLRDAGKIDLDRSLAEFLTSYAVPSTDDWTPQLSLRQLLSHTAGLAPTTAVAYQPGDYLPTLPELLQGSGGVLGPVRLVAVPGLQAEPSAAGLTLAQLAITDAVGGEFTDTMDAWVLQPMTMTDSTFGQPLPRPKLPLSATGHLAGAVPIEAGFDAYPQLIAAGLWSSAADLATFIVQVQRSVAGYDDAVLTPESVADLFTEVAAGAGLGVTMHGEPRRWSAEGVTTGYDAEIVAYAGGGQGAVVLLNANDTGPLRAAILEAIAREYGWVGFVSAAPAPVDLDARTLARYEGSYLVRDGLVVELRVADAQLWLDVPAQPPLLLQPISTAAFVASSLDVSVSMQLQGRRVTGIVLDQGHGPLVAPRR